MKISKIPFITYLLRFIDDARVFITRAFFSGDNGKMIVITGAPRSGTTWFGEMLNSNRVRVYHEPFIRSTLLWNWNLKIHDDAPADLNTFQHLLSRIISGKEWKTFVKFKSEGNFRNPIKFSLFNLFGVKSGRAIVKDPGLCYLMDIFESLVDCEVILIFRNPLSIVSSLKRLNWLPNERIKIIYNHPYFAKYNLRQKFDYLFENMENYSLIEKLALQTGILHYIMMDYSKRSRLAKVYFYEELAENPLNSFKKIFEELNMRYNKINSHNHASLSMNSNTKHFKNAHVVKRSSLEFKDVWTKRLTVDEIQRIMTIYNSFDLGIYKNF